MLTGVPLRLTVSSLAFILSGMIVGNPLLIYVGLLPVVYVLLSLAMRQPGEARIEAPEEPLSAYVDEVLTVSRRLVVRGGLGLVTVGEEVPPNFELVEGNNFRVIWKGLGDLEEAFTYRVRCTRRGVYELRGVEWETRHPQEMTPTMTGSAHVHQDLIVKPRSIPIKRVRQHRLYSLIPMPSESRIKIGLPTNDFRELRDYKHGDPYRQINWKATARLATQREKVPTVNEYEKEGRRVVWIFLDCARGMALGTTIKNSFEYAVQAVLGLSEFYLNRQCMVGLALYNDDSRAQLRYTKQRLRAYYKGWGRRVMPDIASAPRIERLESGEAEAPRVVENPDTVLFPEAGKVQHYKIWRMLPEAEISGSPHGLRQTITRCKRHILGTNPLFIVVTTVEEGRMSSFVEGLREFQRYIPRTRKRTINVILLHVSGYRLASKDEAQEAASRLLELEERAFTGPLRNLGVTVVNWKPTQQNLFEVILSQAVRR